MCDRGCPARRSAAVRPRRGPSNAAHRTGRPTQTLDLEPDDRWPTFGQAAATIGLQAVFAFPLTTGSAHLGALTLDRHTAGRLTTEQFADALAASHLAHHLLTSPLAERPPNELDRMLTVVHLHEEGADEADDDRCRRARV